MTMNVLVTGGAGFMGSHVARNLVERGYNVVVLDDLSGGFRENVDERCEFIQGSIIDSSMLAMLFNEYRFKYVFHQAAYAAEGLSHFIKRFNYLNNLVGSVNLINESIKTDVKCFIFTSSIAVYGTNKLPMREGMVPAPEDSYGIAKFAVEQELRISYEMFGLRYIIFRPHNVYGEHQNIGDIYRNVIGIFFNRLMKSEAMPIFGDGDQTRAFSYIDDVAPVIARSIEVPEAYNETFNIGSDTACSIKQLATFVADAMKLPLRVEYLDSRNEVKHAYSDHSKVREIFGAVEETSLEEGLHKMAKWVKKVGVRSSKKFDGIEIYKNIPPSWLDPVYSSSRNKTQVNRAT